MVIAREVCTWSPHLVCALYEADGRWLLKSPHGLPSHVHAAFYLTALLRMLLSRFFSKKKKKKKNMRPNPILPSDTIVA